MHTIHGCMSTNFLAPREFTSCTGNLSNTLVTGYFVSDTPCFSKSCARSSFFAATDPQIPEYCDLLRTDEWPTCAFISPDCRPTNPAEESHNLETSNRVWEKTLELIGLPSDAVERLIEG